MTRLRFDGVETTLGDDLDDSSTSVTFAEKLAGLAGDVPTITAPDYLVVRVDDEIMHVTAYTSGATTATVSRGEEGTTAAEHDDGAQVRHVPTAEDFGSTEVTIDSQIITSGNLTVGTTEQVVTTLTVDAVEGDWLALTCSGLWENDSAQAGRLDAATRVASADVTRFSSRTSTRANGGVQGWECADGAVASTFGATVFLQVTSSDLEGGQATVRVVAWMPSGTRTLRANTARPFFATLQNLGAAPF